jgi:hypothetical protein
MSDIKIKYGRGEITYWEAQEYWNVTAEGAVLGHRSSLKEAKKLIDKLGDEEKKLERHAALLKRYSGPYQTVTVTSYPEETWGGPKAWVTRTEGGKKIRSQESFNDLYEDTAKNQAIVAELLGLDEKIEVLNKEKHALRAKLEKYTKRKIQ